MHQWSVRVTIPERGDVSETLLFVARYVEDATAGTYDVEVPLRAFGID